MRKSTFNALALTLFIWMISGFNSLIAQDFNPKEYRIYFKLNSKVLADNSRVMEVSFTTKNKKDRKINVPVFKAPIEFYEYVNDEKKLLATVETDEEGLATYRFKPGYQFKVDEEGFATLGAEFKKTKVLKRQRKKISFVPLLLETELNESEDAKTVTVYAHTIDSLGQKVPANSIDAVIGVKGIIATLPLEEATIEDGEFSFEFPDNIPGNPEGGIILEVFIEDHDEYGTIYQETEVNWGVATLRNTDDSNKLWSEGAPLWMYIVLTILLVGVWANYIYSIKNLMKIKKEAPLTD